MICRTTQLSHQRPNIEVLLKKTLEAGKRVIVNEIVHQEESLKEITDLLRTITAGNNARRIQNADKEIATLYWDLYNVLPKDTTLWNYNGAAMQPYREKIDEITNLYIEHYHKDDFSNIIRKLDAVDSIYGEAYGKQSNYKDNKLQDLHVRFGNRILKEMKASSSIFKGATTVLITLLPKIVMLCEICTLQFTF